MKGRAVPPGEDDRRTGVGPVLNCTNHANEVPGSLVEGRKRAYQAVPADRK